MVGFIGCDPVDPIVNLTPERRWPVQRFGAAIAVGQVCCAIVFLLLTFVSQASASIAQYPHRSDRRNTPISSYSGFEVCLQVRSTRRAFRSQRYARAVTGSPLQTFTTNHALFLCLVFMFFWSLCIERSGMPTRKMAVLKKSADFSQPACLKRWTIEQTHELGSPRLLRHYIETGLERRRNKVNVVKSQQPRVDGC